VNVNAEEHAVVTTMEKPDAAGFVRRLAGRGTLKEFVRSASDDERRRLWSGACEIAWPLVFARVTRRAELRRNHYLCASGVHRLEPECLDRFHDDVEAVLDDLFTHADVPIQNLEGWLTARLRRATVDAHRRRRGRRGAPQRPRVPEWVVIALNADPWLVALAKAILEWVGVQATAGLEVWPLTAWAASRATATGDYSAAEPVVAAEVATVLAAMRRRPAWYDRYVEQPLGRKQAPVWLALGAGVTADPEPLVAVEPHELEEALLWEQAAAAMDALRERRRRGGLTAVDVIDVLSAVFGTTLAADGLDRVPGGGPGCTEQFVEMTLAGARQDQIVATVLDLLSADDPAQARAVEDRACR
jgi:hypothetical protein